MGVGGWMFFGVVVGIIVWMTAVYHGLVALRNRCRSAFSQIEVQLRRRYDLIPNLLETVKGYTAHERETLDAVNATRSGAVQAAWRAAAEPGRTETMRDLVQAEVHLAGALRRLVAVVEGYPRLKANENMLAVRAELTSTEHRVAFTRQGYNDAALEYNVRRERFPASLIATLFAFAPAAILPAPDGVQDYSTPRVSAR